MAKVTGALFSLGASGTVGKTVTYSTNRGVAQARFRVIPRNPRTEGQVFARTAVRFTGAMVSRINRNQVGKKDGDEDSIKGFLVAETVLPNTWNSQFLRTGLGNTVITFNADLVLYAALSVDDKVKWVAFNDAFSLPFSLVSGAPSDERVFLPEFGGFLFARALARAGYLDTLPLNTPPVWDNA